ncbi:MAG: hypothetical protein ACOY3K_02415 [Candidatus Omnitrophota bacterium]
MKKVLIIDESSFIIDAIKKRFKHDGKLDLVFAGTAKEIEHHLKKNPPALIISNHIHKEGEVVPFFLELKNQGTFPNCPLLYFTHCGEIGFGSKAEKAGATAVFVRSDFRTLFKILANIAQDLPWSDKIAQDKED